MPQKKIAVNYPKNSNNLVFRVDGLFAYPEQWKATDQANPGMFTYKVKMSNIQITDGKIYQRELTEKQLRQEESKKKGGKKQAKKQQNPAQAQKLKEQLQKQQQQQRRREQQFNKLSPQEQFHQISEDPYKSAILKFENNTAQSQLQGKQFVIFQQRVCKDQGQWVYIYKMPTANQQDLAKMKKAKPKTLNNANDLNPVCMRAWINLSDLNSQKNQQVQYRCPVQQFDSNQESPTPNLQKTYIKLKISLDSPLLAVKDKYQPEDVIKQPELPKQVAPQIKCVQDMKEQLRLGLQSLAMEYSSMFSKQLNFSEQQKQANIFGSQKKNENTKRKQQFLYDFNVSGKYKILKERLKKHIVYLCQNKYKQQMKGVKSFTGITCSVRDQFYSEIYNFLVNSYSDTMNDLVEQNKQRWQQVQVLNKQTQQTLIKQHLNKFRPNQTVAERIKRNLSQYNLYGQINYGSCLFDKQIKENPKNLGIKYQYSLYCLKNGLKKADDPILIRNIEDYLSHNQSNNQVKVFYILLLIQSQNPELLQKAWVILRDVIANKKIDQQQPIEDVIQYLYTVILFQLGGYKQVSQKYQHIAARRYLRKTGKINKQGTHKQDPSKSEVPSVSGLALFQEQLAVEDKDKMWIKISDKLLELGFIKSGSAIMNKISNKQTKQYKRLQIGIQMLNKNYQSALNTLIGLYNETKESLILQKIIVCLFILKKYEEAQTYLKISLKVSDQNGKKNALFLLGKLYLSLEKFGNAKACLSKYIQVSKEQCGGLSWKLLGAVEFKLGNLSQALQCLRFANLNDPKDDQVWIILAQVYAGKGNFTMVNQCLNCYQNSKQEDTYSDQDKKSIQNIKKILQEKQGQNYYNERIRQKMCERVSQIYNC